MRYEDGTVEEIDVSQYNQWKRANPYRNGVDRIFFTVDQKGFIETIIASEAKSTGGDSITKRMIADGNNAPTRLAIERSARSSASHAPDMAKLDRYVYELHVQLETGKISLDQFNQQMAEINVATSNQGRPTQAVMDRALEGSRYYIAVSRNLRVFWSYGRALPATITRWFRGGDDGDH